VTGHQVYIGGDGLLFCIREDPLFPVSASVLRRQGRIYEKDFSSLNIERPKPIHLSFINANF